jgi:hypothetical protein
MNPSLFIAYIERYFPNYVASVSESLNGRSLTNQIPFLFLQLLTPRFTADSRWQAVSALYQGIAADVIALGSATPLKGRDSINTYTGELPKIGTKRSLNEVEMKNIDAMIAQQRPVDEIVNRIFSDVPFVINAVDERLEDIFLSMLSTGTGVATNNVGAPVEFKMHFRAENMRGCSTIFSADGATPLTDIDQRIVSKADEDGNVIRFAYADDTALRNMYKNAEVRNFFGFQREYPGTIPTLSFEQLRTLFDSKWGIELRRVARNTRTEVNGVRSTHKAWKDGNMTFTCDEIVGDLVYTSTAEENRPVSGVAYQKANDYCLVSQFSEQEPLMEYTKSQAMAVPVINNVERIYTLDTKIVEA